MRFHGGGNATALPTNIRREPKSSSSLSAFHSGIPVQQRQVGHFIWHRATTTMHKNTVAFHHLHRPSNVDSRCRDETCRPLQPGLALTAQCAHRALRHRHQIDSTSDRPVLPVLVNWKEHQECTGAYISPPPLFPCLCQCIRANAFNMHPHARSGISRRQRHPRGIRRFLVGRKIRRSSVCFLSSAFSRETCSRRVSVSVPVFTARAAGKYTRGEKSKKKPRIAVYDGKAGGAQRNRNAARAKGGTQNRRERRKPNAKRECRTR